MSVAISGAEPVLKSEPFLKPTRMSLRSCGLRSRSIAATVHLDKLVHRTIFSIPRPDRGRASKAFKGRGRPERRAGDAARFRFGIGAGTPATVGAVAVRWVRKPRTAAQAARSRRATARHGIGAPRRSLRHARASRSTPSAVDRCRSAARHTRRHPKRQPPGVARSKPTNTARGTPGNRHFRDEDCLCTQTYLRAQGHGVLGAPAFRAPSDF